LIRLDDDDDDDDDDDATCMRTYDISCFFPPTSLLQVARAGGHQNGERVLGAEIWPFRLQPSDRCSAAVPWKLIVGSWGSQVASYEAVSIRASVMSLWKRRANHANPRCISNHLDNLMDN
jgi:hypothetical protein